MSCTQTTMQEPAAEASAPEADEARTSRHSGVVRAREARLSPRVPVKLHAQLASLDPDGDSRYTLTMATTLDVSGGGLGLAVDGHVTVGQRVVVEVEIAPDQWLVVQGRVAWASEDAAGACFVGVAFTQPLPCKFPVPVPSIEEPVMRPKYVWGRFFGLDKSA